MASGDLEKRYNKLEVLRFQEEIYALNLKYSGVKELSGQPARSSRLRHTDRPQRNC